MEPVSIRGESQMSRDLVAPMPRVVAFEVEGLRRIGVALGTQVHDVSDEVDTISLAMTKGSTELESLAGRGAMVHDIGAVRLVPPVDPSARIFCVALNYRAHAEESGGANPGLPVIFHKLDTTLVGPFDDIQTPRYTAFLDYEAELAVLIGRDSKRVSGHDWKTVVGGYTVMNDVSCRDAQPTKLGDQTVIDWFSAKAADNTTPVGPWIVPADQVADPQDLHVTLRRNGELMQDASTDLMIFPVARLIEFISERVTLRAGDLIATGTPSGVGKARGIRLLPGDLVETEVAGIGRIANRVTGPHD